MKRNRKPPNKYIQYFTDQFIERTIDLFINNLLHGQQQQQNTQIPEQWCNHYFTYEEIKILQSGKSIF